MVTIHSDEELKAYLDGMRMLVIARRFPINHLNPEDGDPYYGNSPVEVVKDMANPAGFTMVRTDNPVEYIQGVIARVKEYMGVDISAPGETPEEICASFLRDMRDKGFYIIRRGEELL